MTDTSIPEAFAALSQALAAEAVRDRAGRKRVMAFVESVEKLDQRWKAGEMPFVARSPKAAAPVAEPDPPVAVQG
jgi:hypothetical protein